MSDSTIAPQHAQPPPVPPGDLNDQLLSHRLLDRPDGRRRRHPDRRRPVRDRRRRHRLVRARSTTCASPACPTRADQGARPRSTHPGRPTSTSPGSPRSPAASGCAPTPRRARTTSGASRRYAVRGGVGKTRSLEPLLAACSPSRSSPTTTRPRPGRSFEAMEREANRIRYHDMLVKGQVRMVRRRSAAATSRSSRRPRAPPATKRVAFRIHVRAPRRRLPGPEVPARPAGVPHRAPGLPATSSTPTSRTSTSTSG